MEKTAPIDRHFTLSSHQTLEVASEILDHISKWYLRLEMGKHLMCD